MCELVGVLVYMTVSLCVCECQRACLRVCARGVVCVCVRGVTVRVFLPKIFGMGLTVRCTFHLGAYPIFVFIFCILYFFYSRKMLDIKHQDTL